MLFQGFERQTISGIHCVVGGQGPPVLLLHGFPQCLTMWAKVAPILAERYRVICADLRGYGKSHKPVCAPDNSNYSFRAMADDQIALMKELGHSRFHVIGHDRGGRTAHRMALDHPDQVLSLAVLDIAPTYTMFMETNRKVSGAYWHWYFLSTPAPFPETLIGSNPDYFYETCLIGWGATGIESFDPEMLAEYRGAWRTPEMIHGSCSDYRAAATIDLTLDSADLGRKVACPALVFWGSKGVMHRLFDLADCWRPRLADMRTASLPGGHFFIDQFPQETADILRRHLDGISAG